MAREPEVAGVQGRRIAPLPEVPDRLTKDDIVLNLKGDILGIVTGYGGERIVAGPRMESMIDELYDYVVSLRARAFVAAMEEENRG